MGLRSTLSDTDVGALVDVWFEADRTFELFIEASLSPVQVLRVQSYENFGVVLPVDHVDRFWGWLRPVRPVSLPGDRSEGVMFEAERIDNYDGDLERCSIGLVSLSGEQSKGGSRSTERVDVNGDGLERCPVGLVSLFGKQSKGAVFKAEV
ncbi:hypothetical protein H4Q26_014362 [Puccinia striiformis f. sp. tritici PST-130]|nr:hypothetical protein H4Q26_014362 [Puccinia striiformis f. sp. tritici PST-130]